MSWKELFQDKYKSTKIHDTAFFYHGFYLQPNTPILILHISHVDCFWG